MVYKNSIKTSFHLNSHFQNLKIFGFDFASPKILKSFRNINKFYISQVENLSEDKHMSMVFHSNITGLYSFILGRPTFQGPQAYILTTTGYCENFFQNIYANNLSNYNPRLWSKFYISISSVVSFFFFFVFIYFFLYVLYVCVCIVVCLCCRS